MTGHDEIFSDNRERKRFELRDGAHVVFATYRGPPDAPTSNIVVIGHVEAPPEMRGSGMAGRLMAALAAHARAHGLRIVPVCPYAAIWFRRHPADKDVLAAGMD